MKVQWSAIMQNVRIGIIGMGNMGKGNAKYLIDGKIPQVELNTLKGGYSKAPTIFLRF